MPRDSAPDLRPDVIDAACALIARNDLLVDSLQTRNSDRLDFHEVAVWQIRAALGAAYLAGYLFAVGQSEAQAIAAAKAAVNPTKEA